MAFRICHKSTCFVDKKKRRRDRTQEATCQLRLVPKKHVFEAFWWTILRIILWQIGFEICEWKTSFPAERSVMRPQRQAPQSHYSHHAARTRVESTMGTEIRIPWSEAVVWLEAPRPPPSPRGGYRFKGGRKSAGICQQVSINKPWKIFNDGRNFAKTELNTLPPSDAVRQQKKIF